MVNLRILLLIFSFTPLQIFAQTPSGGGEFCTEKIAENQEFASGVEKNIDDVSVAAQELGRYDGGATSKLVEVLRSQSTSCATKKNVADWACVETCSPAVKSFTDEWGGTANIAAMVGGSGLIGDKCGTIATILKTAQLAMTAFQAACAGGKAICTTSCKGIAAAAQKVSTATDAAIEIGKGKLAAACATPGPACVEETGHYTASVKAKISIVTHLGQVNTLGSSIVGKCDNYKEAKNNAMAGALLAIQGMKTADACEKKTSNQVAAVDCSTTSSPGYNTPNCQCARGEKSAAECQNINVNSASIKQGSISIPNTANNASGENGVPAAMDLSGEQQVLGPQASTPSGAAMPIDGGGAGMGGGGGGTGGAQDGASAPKRFNTNILGGGFGGGGGGGGGSGGGPGYGEMDSQLKSYMPGEKNDPNRSVASQLAKEVTPQAGRTNWEKVRLRYRDHYSSLLNK